MSDYSRGELMEYLTRDNSYNWYVSFLQCRTYDELLSISIQKAIKEQPINAVHNGFRKIQSRPRKWKWIPQSERVQILTEAAKYDGLTDEQMKAMKQRIFNTIVCAINEDSVPYESNERYDTAAANWLKNNPQNNIQTVIGKIIMNRKAMFRDMHHGTAEDKYEKLQLLPAIKNVLELGTYIGYKNDFDGKQLKNHYFVGKVTYGDKEKIVFCRVRENTNDNGRFYVHEIFTEDEIRIDAINTTINNSTNSFIDDLRGKELYLALLERIFNVDNSSELAKALYNESVNTVLKSVQAGTTSVIDSCKIYSKLQHQLYESLIK